MHRRQLTLLFAVILFVTGSFAAPVSLTGTVKDKKGTAVAGALVMLKSNPAMKDTTDTAGVFSLSFTTAIRGGRTGGHRYPDANDVVVRNNCLVLSVGEPAGSGIVSIFAANGTRCGSMAFGKLEAGEHRRALPRLAPGSYVLQIAIDRFEALRQLVVSGDGAFLRDGRSVAPDAGSATTSGSTAGAVDSIAVQKLGYVPTAKAVETYDQKGIAVVLDLVSILPAITDYSVKGPFATKIETGVGPNKGYTVFRPDPLGQNGFLHAPIVFGPGITQTVQPVHTTMLTNYASHGFVVVGTPVLSQGPGGAQNLKTMQDGLDWIVQQNTTAGSIYQGKLWTDHCVSMGFSVGGTSAVQMGGAAAVFTVVSIHGHTAEAALHGPMLQTTGTLDSYGMTLQQATYDKSKVQTFMGTLTGAAHTYIESNGGGEERKAITAWMRYWIYNDTLAKNFFYGNDCVLCKSPWQNPQRKNWK